MRLSLRVIVSFAAVVPLVLAGVILARIGVTGVPEAIGFGCLVAVGGVLAVALPGDRAVMPIGQGAYVGYALYTVLTHGPVVVSVWQVIAVGAVGLLIGSLPRIFVDGGARLDLVADRVLVVLVLPPVLWLIDGWLDPFPSFVVLAGLVFGILLTLAVQMVFMAVYQFEQAGGRFGRILRDEIAIRWPFQLFGALFGLIVGLTVHVVGLLGLVVAVVPAATTQIAILRWTTVRSTRMETVRSLSRIPELGGYVDPGHSRRVGELVNEIAREIGLSEARTRLLNLAATMHDIGQVSLAEPVPGGTTSLLERRDQQRIARLGAAVIREGGGLDAVATFVERFADPYRKPDGRRDQNVPLESRILRVANAYDDLVSTSPDPEIHLQAVERIELALSRDYDPEVTRALGRVVERRHRLPVG